MTARVVDIAGPWRPITIGARLSWARLFTRECCSAHTDDACGAVARGRRVAPIGHPSR